MSRRAFLQAGLAVGAVLLARPSSASAARGGPSRLVVRVDPQLGLQGVALAEAYLAALARALKRPVLARLDAMPNDPPREASEPALAMRSDGSLSAAHGEPELLSTARWWLGPAFQSVTRPAEDDYPLAPLGLVDETPLSIETSRNMPMRWLQLLEALRLQSLPNSVAPMGVSSRDPLAQQLASAIFGAPEMGGPRPICFRSEQTLRLALVGNQLAVAVLPLRHGFHVGVPGDFGSPIHSHRRGELRIFAIAGRSRVKDLPDVPTLDEALGAAGYHAHWQAVLLASTNLPEALAASVKAATSHFRQARLELAN